MSNSVNMKTLLFGSDFLFPISSFTLFYHRLCRSQNLLAKALFVNHLRSRNFLTSAIQKSNHLVDNQSNLPLNHQIIAFN